MPTTLKTNHYYVNKQYGMFRVGDISKNGILIAIWDTKNDRDVVICKYLTDAVEINKKEYIIACKPNIILYEYA